MELYVLVVAFRLFDAEFTLTQDLLSRDEESSAKSGNVAVGGTVVPAVNSLPIRYTCQIMARAKFCGNWNGRHALTQIQQRHVS